MLLHQGGSREASKLIQAGGWYYLIYSRTGGGSRYVVAKRAKNITGPWSEEKQIMAPNLGSNQPNQGGIVQGPDEQWYFLTHHGKGDWEGRAVSLLPVTWKDEWPVIGSQGEDGLGYMVWNGNLPLKAIPEKKEWYCDDFSSERLEPHWEWNHYPDNEKWSLAERPGWLRMKAVTPLQKNNLKKVPNILTQRVYRTSSNEVTVKMDIHGMVNGQTAGLCHYAATYAWLGVTKTETGISSIMNENERITSQHFISGNDIWLRSDWGMEGICRFSYSTDGENYQHLGEPYPFTWGHYRGTRVGLFTFHKNGEEGFVDVDSFIYKRK